jgi:hypothetical protein
MPDAEITGAEIVRPLILKELLFGENRAENLRSTRKANNEKNITFLDAIGRIIDL